MQQYLKFLYIFLFSVLLTMGVHLLSYFGYAPLAFKQFMFVLGAVPYAVLLFMEEKTLLSLNYFTGLFVFLTVSTMYYLLIYFYFFRSIRHFKQAQRLAVLLGLLALHGIAYFYTLDWFNSLETGLHQAARYFFS